MNASRLLRQSTSVLRQVRRTPADRRLCRPSRLYSTEKGKEKEKETDPPAAEVESTSTDPASSLETATPSESAESSREAELAAKVKAKEDEVVDVTGRLRYLQADFLNLQSRSAKEREQTRDFAIRRFASDLLETVDVLSIALRSVPEPALATAAATAETSTSTHPHPTSPPPTKFFSPSTSPSKSSEAYLTELHNGVSMTHRMLLAALASHGVQPFDPTGEKFDPNKHEALYQAPVPGKTPGTVLDCQKIGYMLKDRVLRAAQVGVVQGES